MADQEPTENVDETTATPAPEAEQQSPTADAEATEAAQTPTGGAAPGADTAGTAAPAEPVEQLAPKERRRRARTAKAAKVKPRVARTPEERQADRVAVRADKARLRREGRAKARAKAKASPSGEATPAREHVDGTQKLRTGVVVSDKADKTITVRIDVARRHRRYAKVVRTSRTLHAHDESNDAHIGDTVTVREARPLSRTKRWRLIDVIQRAR